MKFGGQWRDFPVLPRQAHRPGQDLWIVMSLGDVFINSEQCVTVEQVLATVARMDRKEPVSVFYLGQPAHISEPLASDGSWDGN